MSFSAEKIKKYMKNPIPVRVYDSVDSTNNEAKRRAACDGGVRLYAASHQTAGRGRRGRSFYSPADTGLYMTLALPIDRELSELQPVTCAAGAAVCEAIEDLTGRAAGIKWVNDIMLDGKKVAGILAELIGSDIGETAVIIGVGINLTTESFPAEFAERAGSIGEVEPELLCAAVADRLIGYCGASGYNSVMEKYRSRSLCLGRTVSFIRDGKKITASAVGIDSSGGLTVENEAGRFTLNSGEISIIM